MDISQTTSPVVPLVHHLTARERDIVELVMTGATNKEIAHHLGISLKTVERRLAKVFAKTAKASHTQLAVRILRMKLCLRQQHAP